MKTFVWQLVYGSAPWGSEDGYPTPPPCHLSGSIVACCKSHKDTHSEERRKHGKVLLGTTAHPQPVTRVEYDMRVSLCLELYSAQKVIFKFKYNSVWVATKCTERMFFFPFSVCRLAVHINITFWALGDALYCVVTHKYDNQWNFIHIYIYSAAVMNESVYIL